MKKSLKGKGFQRIVSAFMAVAMVFSLMPVELSVDAATTNYPDSYTVKVTDGTNVVEGATVELTSTDITLSLSQTTDGNGEAAFATADIENALTAAGFTTANASVKVIKDTFETKETAVTLDSTNLTANVDVTLESILITDVSVEGKSLTYTGGAQELVSVTAKEGDTVVYTVDGVENTEIPTATEVGTYTIDVKVSRAGKTDYTQTVTASISQATIEGIAITANSLKYDGTAKALVALTGEFLDNDTVTWTLNGVATEDRAIPTGMAVGDYTVKLTVNRGTNYILFEQEVMVNIALGDLDLGELSITPNNRTYDGTEQPLITVANQGDYNLKYSLTGADGTWEDTIPQKTDAGTYNVYVKARKDNYADKNFPEVPVSVTISAAEQEFCFDVERYRTETSIEEVTDSFPFNKTFDFSATDTKALAGGSISYRIEADNGIASINATTGELTVSYPGEIKVIATLSSTNSNYKECEISHVVTVSHEVSTPGDYLELSDSDVEYVLGTSDTISTITASVKDPMIAGAITYSLKSAIGGIAVDAQTGVVTVDDYTQLVNNLHANNGNLPIEIVAKKAADSGYGEDSLSYTIVISFGETPADVSFTVEAADVDNDGTASIVNGWCKEGVSVAAPSGYEILKDFSESWGSTVVFTEAGIHKRYVYLRNTTTNEITDKIEIEQEIKIDNEKPDLTKMNIEFSETSLMEQIGEELGFYKPDVTITFTAEDPLSGIDHFDVTYTKEANSSDKNEETFERELAVTIENGVATAQMSLSKDTVEQYRGEITFTATDKAGNESESKSEDYVFIVDDISPVLSIAYAGDIPYNSQIQEIDGYHFFNSEVEVKLTVDEANFYEDIVEVLVSKDGAEATEVAPTWTTGTGDEHIGTFMLDTDGEYVVSVSGKDKSKNEMEAYTSDHIVVDLTDPVMNATFDAEKQKIILEITERNFRASDVSTVVSAVDVSGNVINVDSVPAYVKNDANWTHEEDVHTLVIESYSETSPLVDGIYDFTFTYLDLASRVASEEKLENIKIDCTAPDKDSLKITYSNEVFTEKIKEKLGIYATNVTITFEVQDAMSDIKEFIWEYKKADDASSGVLETDTDVIAATMVDGKGTASITLPREEAQQLKGHIAVQAIDACNNTSEKLTDTDNIIIVDTIGPKLTVDYGLESKKVEDKIFYNKNIKATFTVTEENFVEEDVKVYVSKNEGEATPVTVKWEKKKAGVYIGTYVIKQDGDYVVSVEYQDKMGNRMVDKNNKEYSYVEGEETIYRYKSDVLTLDKTLPVISVEYQNQNIVTTAVDNENHNREYLADTQTATINIKEHNFDKEGVLFDIIATDVAGTDYNVDSYITKSAWRKNGNTHSITITYSGEANYTFDIECLDLAMNEAKDYEPDYFTVDRTAPENMTVEYSSSLIETVLEAITFGFYNAKMTVSITAEDQVSGIDLFEYSYINAEGVSSVNGELINQSAENSEITYSDGGKTATLDFEIPADVLREGTQFNGSIEFSATDRSGNLSDGTSDDKRIVVDNIAPVLEVTYNDAVNEAGDIAYYDGDINVTLTMTEANFYEEDVMVRVAKDGGEGSAVTPTWTHESVDIHTGTFTLTEDGDYFISVEYQDKSENVMEPYTSNQLTIDTDIQLPTCRINGVQKEEIGGAYKGDAVVAYSYEDENFDTQTIKLERIRFDMVEDITEEYIHVNNNANGGSGTFEIPSTNNNDGIYVLSIGITDKAMHTEESQLKFTINRYGSVYEYDDYLVSLIADGGQYITKQAGKAAAITENLIITEYNAVELIEDSLNILVTKDGETIDVDYSLKANNADAEVNDWYQYVYEIKASNFAEDGVYKISLTSAYDADDADNNESTSVPENSIDEKGNQILDTMTFTVDTVKPEIRNIVNLEESIVNAQSLDVKYTVVDVGGLQSISIILNGKELETITDFGDNRFNYSGQFTINESADAQTVQLKVVDLAGNVTDTASEDFTTGDLYVFNDTVTVSTNIFVRWYANKVLFWGTIGGVVAAGGLVGLFAYLRSRRKIK